MQIVVGPISTATISYIYWAYNNYMESEELLYSNHWVKLNYEEKIHIFMIVFGSRIQTSHTDIMYSTFYHMMGWKWNVDKSNLSIQVTCRVVVNWQWPAKSNYDLL